VSEFLIRNHEGRCKKELTAHLRKKLAPLDVIDTIVDTDSYGRDR